MSHRLSLSRSIRNSAAVLRTLAAAACVALGTAAPAAAHGFGQRYDLPLPLSLYLFGAAAVVALSFVVFGLFVRHAPATRRGPHVDLLATAPPPAPAHAIFRQGFLSALTNPKLGVFFVTFLPQFVVPGQAVLPRLLELGLVFAVIGWTWMIAYGLLVTRIRAFITAPRVRQWMDRVTGVVLLGFGARLAAERL